MLKRNEKLNWYYAACFTAFWIMLYAAIVVKQVYHLPTPLTHKDAATHTGEFIAERAQDFLLKLTSLGPRVVGSEANEVQAVKLLMDEISEIENQKSDYFDFEVDKQVVSDQYSATRLYQSVQNVMVKLSARTSRSPNYLLINSHFDSKPTSPGASDDGAMVSVMLELLRVLATSNGPLEHPIVFLFNGAEEELLSGSVGFVRQHKWAKNCKVVINLDAAGSGGRELLFRSAANSPWLINYYSRVPHPFTNVLAEELFQFNLIPSDTDFRVFRNFGRMQGLDLAYAYNGYVYHTKFDSFSVFPKSSLQNTGNNVLSLAKSIGNSPEMRNTMTSNYQPEYLIFFDFLGWFVLSYTLNTSIIINLVVCAAALVAIAISLYFVATKSKLSWLPFTTYCLHTLIIQILSLALATGIPLLIAYFMDIIGCSMSWFSASWLICGLYFCPAFFALGICPAIFLESTKKHVLSLNFRIQLFMHSHCLLLIILTITLTFLHIRSAYMCMLPVFFYAAALIVNLITQLHYIGHWFAIPVIMSQIMPFMYFTYVAEYIFFILIPVSGRNGSSTNPDLVISLVAIIITILCSGFLIPLYFSFRKARSIITCFLAATVVFIILASTPIGAPYTAQLAPQRYSIQVAPDEEKEMTYHKKPTSKVPWYLAPAFLIFWLVLIFAVVIPVFLSLPTGLTISNEKSTPNSFIAERAERILINFDRIGPKVVGSHANENHTVELLLEQLEAIKDVMHTDLFEMEIDVQVVSGAYIHWTMVNMYQGVQNVVVRFRTKASTSESYLLINSHFDSKPGSPGSGDDGAMVVVMLETLRVIATTRTPFQHPIIFLFNGAEENPLQASHGFITQHKWAKNCKAVINLDSAGSGNREVLFQTGPNHPWLMDIYRKGVKRSYASTFAEEIFQSGLIPSDTDFRNFRDFGKVPGLDMAHSYNGYVYHTKFDGVSLVPRGTLQTTGNNVLGLVRTFTNSSILKDPSRHAEGHMVFYDFFGYYVVSYTESTGKTLNTCVSVGAILLIGISMYLMAADSFVSICYTLRLFSLIFVLHLIGWILAIALPLLMATIFDSADRSMTWFTSKWLVFGLYICPTLMGLSAPTLLYLSISRNDKVSQPYRLQMVDHAHTLILSILCILLTYSSIRSSYFLMIPLLFHAISLVINMVTTLHKRAYYWSIFVILCQIIPFLYFTYLFHAQLISTMPVMGRFGSASNPDLYIAILTILGTMLSMGYLILLLNIFNRPKLVFLILPAVTLVIALIAMTKIGFPYRPATNVQRVNLQEVRRVFYEYDGTVSRNESGYLFDFQDRRKQLPFAPYVDLEDLYNISDECDKYMMCGMPIFNHRTTKSRRQASFLPREVPLQLPGVPQLTLLRKSINTTTETIRFEFELEGPSHMSIFLQPLEKVTVSDWSFLAAMLLREPPFHVYFSYGKISTPLTFYIDLKKENSEFDEPLMQLGISGHYISFEHERDAETKKFLATFPPYSYIMEWPSSYERYIF